MPPGVAQPPAGIHVVPRGPVPRIEAADPLQRVPADAQVTAGQVVRLGVVNKHVDRPTGSVGHRLGDDPVAGRSDVRPASGDAAGPDIGVCQVAQPVGIGSGVVVEVGDDLPGGGAHPLVPGRAQPLVFRPDHAHVEPGRDLRQVVRRTIVHNDGLEVGVVSRGES